MIVAITGGTGFVGAALARGLVASGHKAKLIARGLNQRDESIRQLANTSFTPITDMDEKKLFLTFSGCDAVAHCMGIHREMKKGDFQKVHVQSTLNVLSAARRANIKKIVLVTYLRARPRMFSAYHKSKWDAEELVRSSELDYTIVKPGLIFGHGDHMVSHISRGLKSMPLVGIFPTVGIFQKSIRPVSIDDVVKVLMAALVDNRLSRQTVAVVGPEEMSLGRAVQRVSKVMHKWTITLPMPALAHYAVACSMENSMKDPLVSIAQIRMLAEGMSQPLPNTDLLPSDLVPQTKFTEEEIRAALGEPPKS